MTCRRRRRAHGVPRDCPRGKRGARAEKERGGGGGGAVAAERRAVARLPRMSGGNRQRRHPDDQGEPPVAGARLARGAHPDVRVDARRHRRGARDRRGLARGVRPEILLSLVGGGSDDHTEVVKAVTAARGDDPQAIDVLLKERRGARVAGAAERRRGRGGVAVASGARAHRRRDRQARGGAHAARQERDRARRCRPRRTSTNIVTPATAWRSAPSKTSPNSPGALLAMATFNGEKGAVAQLETDADRAVAAGEGRPRGSAGDVGDRLRESAGRDARCPRERRRHRAEASGGRARA